MLRMTFLALALSTCRLHAQTTDADLRREAFDTLKKAGQFYREKVAAHGGYVYYYSLDLQQRWGEGKASPDILFVQPPGTPTVGRAFLQANAATGDRYYLDAACAAAEALVYGQLESGGWTQTIYYAPGKRVGKYRNGKGGSWNVSSLDDDQTQSALTLLIEADQALDFKHAAIHDAAVYGLNALLKAQFPNGGFPQVWVGPVAKKPVVKAGYPEYDWKTENRIKNYWDYYTLNDNLAGTVADTLITAQRVYKDDRYRTALEKLGDFLILAQMPDPQPGWCQQYNDDMMPMWGRKFEPPAITGWESQDVMETLIRIARHTGKKKYLEPIPRALAYFKENLQADGKIPRYFELKTNKPLYMDASYRLTYDSASAPAHYGWTQTARFDAVARAFEEVRREIVPIPRSVESLRADVRKIVRDLDGEGRWITTHAGERLVGQPKFAVSFRYISSDTFSRNVETLSAFIAATGK